ncbi:MAG: class I SAM-dependent methyltransferase [bacterium]
MTPLHAERGVAEFRKAYAHHRAAEGRAMSGAQLRQLPYYERGPLATQWRVRARTFDAFAQHILAPMSRRRTQVRLLDLGAGNGWLSYRAALVGAMAVAVDFRDDTVDGLGAASAYVEDGQHPFHRVVGSFDVLPIALRQFDIVVFNASLHYTLDLSVALSEAYRVLLPGGRIAILDSPFYGSDADGAEMVREKHREAAVRFGSGADALMSLPIIEYLTRARLAAASATLGLTWRRHRVWYPLWYELRPVIARLRGRRVPSRFDLWEGTVS